MNGVGREQFMPSCKDCGKQISKGAIRCKSCENTRRWQDKNSAFNSEQRRVRMSETMRRLWQDTSSALHSEQRSAKISRAVVRAYQDPNSVFHTDEYKAKLSEAIGRAHQDPELRAGRAKRMKALWRDEEHRTKMTEMSRGLWQDETYRTMHMGENNPNWHGGKSLEPYGPDWTDELKEEIRRRDEYTCAISGKVWQLGQPTFHIHHIDYDKTNDDFDNLITLALGPHSRTNANRRHWQALLVHAAKGAEMRANAFVKMQT